MIRTFAFLLPTLALATPALAQDDDPYSACVAMQDDAARLACFDRTYQTQRIVVAEREVEEKRVEEEVFGFREADAALERGDETALTATVSEVLRGSTRSQVLLMDNGQLWRETDGSTLRNRIRDGWTATITRHWSGAYEMRFDGRSGYLRVTRMR